MSNEMFYGATRSVFQKAEHLRNRISPAEELLWNYLKDGRMGVEFSRQHPAYLYVLDFYCHALKLAIELDDHVDQLDEVKRDGVERKDHLNGFGLTVLRFQGHDVLSNPQQVMKKIEDFIQRQRNRKGIAPPKATFFDIIPAIDIIDGKCVRLTQGDYAQKKVYNEHPLEVARQFENNGLKRLHLVDLDGARTGAVRNWKVLETIAGRTSLVVDFGGGIKSEEDLEIVYSSGAALATIGSLAVKEENIFTNWILKYGADKFFLGADVKEEKITVSGWTQTTEIWIYDFLQKYAEKGIKQVFCTDVSKDGLLAGPSVELYKSILAKFPGLKFIASGGVSSIGDLDALRDIGCTGAIVGKAIYEGRISLDELKKFND